LQKKITDTTSVTGAQQETTQRLEKELQLIRSQLEEKEKSRLVVDNEKRTLEAKVVDLERKLAEETKKLKDEVDEAGKSVDEKIKKVKKELKKVEQSKSELEVEKNSFGW